MPKGGSTIHNRIKFQLSRRRLFWLILSGFLLYVIFVGATGLRGSIATLRSADVFLLMVAVVWILASYVCASMSYVFLANKHIRFVPTLIVELAGGLVNRLLPGGLGGLGLNAVYMHKNGHGWPEASAVVAVNNLLGFIGNALLLIGVSATYSLSAPTMHFRYHQVILGAGLLAVVLIIGFLLLHGRSPRRLSDSVNSIGRYIKILSSRPKKSVAALVFQCGITASHATALYFVCESLGGHPIFWPLALVAVSAGSVSGAVVPTPGGLGGAEAGIAAVLAAYGLPVNISLAAAVTYRFLTYWLPLVPGYVALKLAEKRYL